MPAAAAAAGRPDGRTSDGTLRPLACELSCLAQADGSALWKSGSTHVLAAVYGPIAPQIMHKEDGHQALVSVVIKAPTGGTSSDGGVGGGLDNSHELGDFLHKTLSCCIDVVRYPRCVVEIVLQIVQADGSLLAGLLHAAVAALMDGGIDLLYLPVATTCLVKSASNNKRMIRLDPTAEEEEDDPVTTLLVFVNEQGGGRYKKKGEGDKILGSHTIGPGVALDDFLACMQVAGKASPAIAAFWRLAVEQKLTRESQTLWSK